jgi:hypothetical protein
MRTILLAAVLVLVSACATTEKAKETWLGASYDDVVRTWGPPMRSGKLSDGSEVHTWVAEGGPTYRSGPSVGIGGFGFGGRTGVGVGANFPIGEGSATPPARCERTLTFRDGRLAEQSWIGPDEICSGFGREDKK